MNETLPISLSGTAELFPPEKLTLAERTTRIRAYGVTALTSYLQMCREIAVAQIENADEIEACGFDSWASDLGLSTRQIQACTLVAKSFRSASHADIPGNATIDVMALRALASPRVPQPVREQAVARAAKGEHITEAKAKEMVDEAVRQAKEEQAAAVRADMQAAIDEALDKANELEKAMDVSEEEINKEITEAVNEATQKLTKEVVDLKTKIGAYQNAKQGKPEIKDIEAIFKRRLGIKSLSDDQWRLMAQLLGTGIAVGKKGFLPISTEELRRNEDTFRLTANVIEHAQGLAGALDADFLVPACLPIQRHMLAEALPDIIAWAQKCLIVLAPYAGEEI